MPRNPAFLSRCPLTAALRAGLLLACLSAATGLDAHAADPPARWSYRELGPEAWGPWIRLSDGPALLEAPPVPGVLLEALGITPSTDCRALEMLGEEKAEEGMRRETRTWCPPRESPLATPRVPAPTTLYQGGAKRATASVSGRILYQDRVFDLSGYTGGIRRLPVRRTAIELRRSSDDSLMVGGSTDEDGNFLLEYDAVSNEDLELRLVSRAEGFVGSAPRVLDSAGPGGDLSGSSPLEYVVLEIIGMGPGTQLGIGVTELVPASSGDLLGAFNLLDQLLDLSDLLADPTWLGAEPDSLPPLIWSPSGSQARTSYQDGVIRVASPMGGDDDSWADAIVLAALGEWYLERYGRSDDAPGSDAFDLANDPRRAYRRGAAIVLSGLARRHRAELRVDADGLPVDAEISAFVDLGFPPPVGFTGLAQDGFDLESRVRVFGEPVLPRGQSSIANVACMLWDLVDDEDTPDAYAGDDDPRFDSLVDGAARFHSHVTGLLALPPGEAITYEDFQADWAIAHGEEAALDSIAVEVGRTALFTDAFEDDADPTQVDAQAPWVQPAPSPQGGIVLTELYLGDRDWVELANTGVVPVDLTGWRVVARRNGFSTGPERETLIAGGVILAPGAYLVLFEGGEAVDDDGFALHDPDWSIPWLEGADGACTLVDEQGTAVDFVRWDAPGEPSSEPVPAGLAFSGSLASPDFGWSLSRDGAGTDQDLASDLAATAPNPYAPNGGFLALRSLHPHSEFDHLRVALAADDRIRVLAAAEREAPRPGLSPLDEGGSPLQIVGPRPGDETSALLEWIASGTEDRAFRLSQDATPLIATGVSFGAWVPWDSQTLLPVADWEILPRNEDPTLDTVDLHWTNTSIYDSLRLFVDAAFELALPGSTQSHTIVLGAGHHSLELEPWQNQIAAPRTVGAIFVGPTPRLRATGIEAQDPPILGLDGFGEVDEPVSGGRALLDHPDPGVLYPPDDVAIAQLLDPVDLTTSSVLRFRHAAHLALGDTAWVEITLDDGVSWQAIASYTGADHLGGSDPADWSDFVLEPGDWIDEELPLGAYASARARFRLRRTSDSAAESLGWMVDDLLFGSPSDGNWWVAPDGDDEFGCGHPERPYASAAVGFTACAQGDTLRLAAGEYLDTVSLDLDGSPRPVNLAPPPGVSVWGAGMDSTLIRVPGLGTGVYCGPLTGWAGQDSASVGGLGLLDGSRGLRVDTGSIQVQQLWLQGLGTALLIEGGELRARQLLIKSSGRAARQVDGSFFLSESTITELERALFLQSESDSTRVERCIFTRITQTAIECELGAPPPVVLCNDFFGFSGSPEVFLGIPDPVGVDGNTAVAVEFCDPFSGDYRLAQSSILLDLPGCGAVGAFGEGCMDTVVGTSPPSVRTRLLGNHPNPFNPRTRIRFTLGREGPVQLRLYDARGRLVRVLLDGVLPAGEHELDWDATDAQGRRVASGIYHLELRADGERHASSMALLK